MEDSTIIQNYAGGTASIAKNLPGWYLAQILSRRRFSSGL